MGGGRKIPEPNSVVTLQKKDGNVYEIRLGGVLNKATADRIQTVAMQEIEKGKKDLKVLIILNGFKGWQAGDNWGDIDFFATYGDVITKIAAVGEAKWKDPMMIFLLAERRRAEVRYFTSELESQARTWLAG